LVTSHLKADIDRGLLLALIRLNLRDKAEIDMQRFHAQKRTAVFLSLRGPRLTLWGICGHSPASASWLTFSKRTSVGARLVPMAEFRVGTEITDATSGRPPRQ